MARLTLETRELVDRPREKHQQPGSGRGTCVEVKACVWLGCREPSVATPVSEEVRAAEGTEREEPGRCKQEGAQAPGAGGGLLAVQGCIPSNAATRAGRPGCHTHGGDATVPWRRRHPLRTLETQPLCRSHSTLWFCHKNLNFVILPCHGGRL